MTDVSIPATSSNTGSSVCVAIGLIPASDMAEILQVSMQTLATWRCKKRGPPSFKLGKKVFYLTAEFTDWMMAQAHQQAEKATKPRKPRARAKTHTPAPPPPRDEDDAQGVLWASS